MDFETYVKEEFKKTERKVDVLNEKVDKLMIFMAVEQAENRKKSKLSAMLIGGIISLIVSVASAFIKG